MTLALVLALDQRIEWQLPLLLLLACHALVRHEGTRWRPGVAAAAMLLACAYLGVNTLASWIDPATLTSLWWQAPLRVGIFYLMLIATSTLMSSDRFDQEAVFRTLEWLFVFKLAIAGFETYVLLQTGESRERPLFNIILSDDSWLGVRLTSSYDVLFALLALARHATWRRLLILLAMIALTETRALALLSVFFFAWRLIRERTVAARLAALVVPALCAAIVVTMMAEPDSTHRLTTVGGSSLDDKLEQIEAVGPLLATPFILTGKGLGASLPGIVRDELRPYSYEAQAPVLLWQGGLLFFAVHITLLWVYGGRYRRLAILLTLGLATLNPALFALASAFFVVALDKALERRTGE